MSPNQIVSLWPPILTELVLVFVHMEHELSSSGKQKSKSKTAVLESFLGGSGFKDPTKWLRLYLAICKLLDLLIILPSDILSHYQVYKWAFTETPGIYSLLGIEEMEEDEEAESPELKTKTNASTPPADTSKNRLRRDSSLKSNSDEEVSTMAQLNAPMSEKKRIALKKRQEAQKRENVKQRNVGSVFLPHVTRIVKILQQKNLGDDSWYSPGRVPGELILMQRKLQSIYDLLPFFVTVTGELAQQDVEVSKLTRFKLQQVEDLIEKDFIENTSALT